MESLGFVEHTLGTALVVDDGLVINRVNVCLLIRVARFENDVGRLSELLSQKRGLNQRVCHIIILNGLLRGKRN